MEFCRYWFVFGRLAFHFLSGSEARLHTATHENHRAICADCSKAWYVVGGEKFPWCRNGGKPAGVICAHAGWLQEQDSQGPVEDSGEQVFVVVRNMRFQVFFVLWLLSECDEAKWFQSRPVLEMFETPEVLRHRSNLRHIWNLGWTFQFGHDVALARHLSYFCVQKMKALAFTLHPVAAYTKIIVSSFSLYFICVFISQRSVFLGRLAWQLLWQTTNACAVVKRTTVFAGGIFRVRLD